MDFESWQNISQLIKIIGGVIGIWLLYKIEKNTSKLRKMGE